MGEGWNDDQPSKDEQPVLALALRTATVDDMAVMRDVMAPFRNRHFPPNFQTDQVRIAQLGDDVVGFVGWKGDEVLALYVADAWRGQRIVGSGLLAAAEAAIRERGHARIRIMIDADEDRARRFYVEHGYESRWQHSEDDIIWMYKAT
ncbi:GNAT family N-acetyltransferase [Sphingobium nicotianae]|uniref:GNAT family N-acetyltransferase n=1 Tax=Sphingobium nicotianae TaxID=2782607 RepID=A0A9X1ITK6_9SPHN|nr:GNAT family N-acetyltransferase [Sphingobium nicotianae]MBT2189402.1 GNAT family N-acetyltransferase [Sphingobium nicotianae]